MPGPSWESALLNPDFRDMLSALCAERAEFMLVGAYALAAHGLPRATGDMDIWIRRSDENAQRVWSALGRFGAPLAELTIDDLKTPNVVFQIGLAPRRDGVEFDEAWALRNTIEVEGLTFAVIGRAHLIQNKKAVGRPQDLADVTWLERTGR
jgi:hypothetical protein